MSDINHAAFASDENISATSFPQDSRASISNEQIAVEPVAFVGVSQKAQTTRNSKLKSSQSHHTLFKGPVSNCRRIAANI